MREVVVTIHETYLSIDGELPAGYRLVIHNHTGSFWFYPQMFSFRQCPGGAEWYERNPDDDLPCYFYVDDPSLTEFPLP